MSPIFQMKRPRLINLGAGDQITSSKWWSWATGENRVVWLQGLSPVTLPRV